MTSVNHDVGGDAEHDRGGGRREQSEEDKAQPGVYYQEWTKECVYSYLSSTMAANFQSAATSAASSSSLTLSVITRISLRMRPSSRCSGL